MSNTSICELLLLREHENAETIYLRQPRHGVWQEYSWSAVIRQARQVAAFLQRIGLRRGDHVSIYSKNCAEWFIADFGITLAGMVNVPLYANQHPESIQYVLEQAGIKAVFIGKLDHHMKAASYVPHELVIINFSYHQDIKTNYTWADILMTDPLQEIVLPKEDDLYTIIYSSGTSGNPKGVMFTHGAISRYLTLLPEDLRRICKQEYYHLLSYLPLAHIYERSAIQLASVSLAADVSFIESLESFNANLRSVKPTIFAAVPRIWSVFQQKINHKIPHKLLRMLLKTPIVAQWIRHKIKQELGLSHCSNFFSGSSHLPEPIFDFFRKQLHLVIQEGYGQTENFGYATVSLLDQTKYGYVGTARLQVEIKLGAEQEILMKSPCLMKGYYKDAQATQAAFTEDGWLRTGDFGELDEEQRVKVISRLSEHFKNQKGEFINPIPIERLFHENKLLEHVCLVGRELESNVLLVCLSDNKKLTGNTQKVKEQLQKTLHRVNAQLESYEKVRHILVVKSHWSQENNMVTPTLKIKRRQIEQFYKAFIQKSLAQHQPIVFE